MSVTKKDKKYSLNRFGKDILTVVGLMFSYVSLVREMPGKTPLGVIILITLISFITLYRTKVFTFDSKYKAPIRNSMLMIFLIEIILLVDFLFKLKPFFNRLCAEDVLLSNIIVFNKCLLFCVFVIIVCYFLLHKLFIDYSFDTYRTAAKDSNSSTLFCVYVLTIVFVIDIGFKLGIFFIVDSHKSETIKILWERLIFCLIAIPVVWILMYSIVNFDLHKKMMNELNEGKDD